LTYFIEVRALSMTNKLVLMSMKLRVKMTAELNCSPLAIRTRQTVSTTNLKELVMVNKGNS
jgi:hypothetical protein